MDEEKILPLGAEITAVGELHSASDGTPVIKSSKRLPIFLYVILIPKISSTGKILQVLDAPTSLV